MRTSPLSQDRSASQYNVLFTFYRLIDTYILMVRFKENRHSLILSLLLLLLTYAAEGWIYGFWMERFLEGDLLAQFAEPARLSILYVAAIFSILLLVIVFSSPVSLMTVSLNGWLKSDTRAFISIFLGAFAFAILVQRIDYFARFLVLLSALFLLKLDLQLIGCSRWLGSFILFILCWLGFTGGILIFYGLSF